MRSCAGSVGGGHDSRRCATWIAVGSLGACAVVFVATIWAHEAAHAAAWAMVGAAGTHVRLGRVLVDGAVPAGTNLDAAMVLAAGPALTALQALASVVLVRRRWAGPLVTSLLLAWSAAVSCAYLGYALLTNHAGNDIGRLLALSQAPQVASTALSLLGLASLAGLGFAAAGWFRRVADTAGVRLSNASLGASAIVMPWMAGVAAPFVLLVSGPDRFHALGMGAFTLAALLARGGDSRIIVSPPRMRSAMWLAGAGAAAWLATALVDQQGGVPLG